MKKKIKKIIEDQGLLEECDIEILDYGLDQIMVYGISSIVALVLGWLMRVGVNGFFFFVVFVPLRLYAGGYHADTRKKCNYISFFILLLVYWMLNDFNWNSRIWVLVGLLAAVIIWFLAPVDNKNHRLDKSEKIKFRKMTRLMVVLFLILLLFLFCFVRRYLGSVIIAYLLVAIILIAGMIKNKTKDKYKVEE